MKQINVRLLLLSLLLFATNVTVAKPIIIAVIDTGISDKLKDGKFLCKMGHKDFTGTGLNDVHGHGTHVSGLIHQHAAKTADWNKSANYCQVILKYWDPNQTDGNPLQQELAA